MKFIKVHYYNVIKSQIGPELSVVLGRLNTLPLEDRLKTCGVQKIRLDDIREHVMGDTTPVWLMKFTKIRDDNWPGVMAMAQEAKDLELDEDQHLSEETFAAYCPASNKLVVQYSHFGVRAPKIKEYFNAAHGNAEQGYALNPVLTEEALEKYEKKKIVTSIDVTIDGISEADIALMDGQGLQATLRESIQAKATNFSFHIGVDARLKKNKIDRGWVENIVDVLRRRGGENDSIVVSAKENEDDAVEAIDLLEARKQSKYNADSIERTAGKRFEPSQMHGLMEQSLREWTAAAAE